VQILHSPEGQILHSPVVQILPSGRQDAEFTRSPGVDIFILAYMRIFHSGLCAKIAFWRKGKKCR
jgi:hypothetical protein